MNIKISLSKKIFLMRHYNFYYCNKKLKATWPPYSEFIIVGFKKIIDEDRVEVELQDEDSDVTVIDKKELDQIFVEDIQLPLFKDIGSIEELHEKKDLFPVPLPIVERLNRSSRFLADSILLASAMNRGEEFPGYNGEIQEIWNIVTDSIGMLEDIQTDLEEIEDFN